MQPIPKHQARGPIAVLEASLGKMMDAVATGRYDDRTETALEPTR